MRPFFVLFFCLLAANAQAQAFEQLTYSNVIKSLVRFDALNLQNDKILDDYAQLNDCDSFYKNFRDDFAMQKRRAALRAYIKENRSEFPDSYYFTAPMRLDQFDFKTRVFRLHDKSKLTNVNSFSLVALKSREVCVKGAKLTFVPDEIGVVIDQPVTIEGLPIAEDKAAQLIKRMNAAKNFNRVIYTRFSLLLVFAPPIVKETATRYNADAQLLSVEFFEDKEMTKPIWIYTRS